MRRHAGYSRTNNVRIKVMEALQMIGIIVAVVAAWFILNRWVLPKFGIKT
jgi:hypothetical protein